VVRVLVTGAAGFIGSTTAELLLSRGNEVVALDSLVTGRIENVPPGATFVEGDCGDVDLVRSLGHFDACVHFAASIEAGESMKHPEDFFSNNAAASFRLLDALIKSGVERFVFSSSCALYGNQIDMPIDESRPTQPQSPYGQSKRMVEEGLSWLASTGRLRAIHALLQRGGGILWRTPNATIRKVTSYPLRWMSLTVVGTISRSSVMTIRRPMARAFATTST
jgi:UDP-glucose 4-epimerase